MPSRRDFLQSGLLATAAMENSMPSFAASQPDTSVTSESATLKNGVITFLQTTDVHCQLHAHDELFWENDQLTFRKAGGYAHVATALDALRKENPANTLTIDTGDMFQGSLLSVKTTGRAFVPLLNALSYDMYLPGNWEVVYYKKNMQKLLGGLLAPKVCTNMYHDLGDGKKGELIFQPYQIVNRLGIKIGFLGYIDPLVPLRQSPLYSKGILYTKPEENLKEYVELLKEQEQCDFIIILSHLGLSQQIALGNHPDCKSVDYIFGADTHERVRKPIQAEYTKIVEPGAFGSFVGRLDLKVENGKIVKESYQLIEVNPQKYPAKKEITALIEELEKPYKEEINKVIGYSTLPLYRNFVVENTIDTMIVDALKWKVNADVVLSNGFRFCPPRTAGKDGKIAITEGYLYDMLPVDSTIRTGTATGAQLLEWLEKELQNVFAQDASKRFGGWLIRFKGMQVEFKAFERVGRRVQKVVIAGQLLDPQKEYTLCACERDGDPEDMLCRMRGIKNAQNTAFTLHSMMKEYLKEFSPVTPALRHDAKVLDAPQTLLSQVYGVDYTFV
ncbi:bifunctional metallophosphatase/5'-nucleotidase [Runella slithyformis]|uniref:5'-nucleotidase n=1 Tax=Runella slithyformis (strain ATCC 29530 / DSM 19594 / LMG 11500 / NCIMB 11436 / LSU 4) TaxID=761193 RepID=A0A7U3ZRS7_RUNSL|nr:bifunctional metallophosphatase/5'-nucleotidase [Runella slithyformis]AEI52191.1 5'-nucleotidase [Runella slithyformis DSM 19594]